MKRRHLITVSGLAAASLLIMTTPAEAGPYRTCKAIYGAIPTIGGNGGGSEHAASKTYLDAVHLTVSDTNADGHHVAVRLVTRRNDGTDHFWSWHALYSGAGTGDSWDTTATDSAGIRLIYEEVGVFEGDSRLGGCVTTAYAN